jgi:hypothetical protein
VAFFVLDPFFFFLDPLPFGRFGSFALPPAP